MRFKTLRSMINGEISGWHLFVYGSFAFIISAFTYIRCPNLNTIINTGSTNAWITTMLFWWLGFIIGNLIYEILNYKSYIKNKQPTWAKAKYSTIEPLVRLYPNRYHLFTNESYGNYGLEYDDYSRNIYYTNSYYFYMTSLWEYYKIKVLLTEINKELKHIENEKAENRNTETLYKLWQKDIDEALIQSNKELEQAKQTAEQIASKESYDNYVHAQIFSNIMRIQTSAPKVKVNPAVKVNPTEICGLKTDIRR